MGHGTSDNRRSKEGEMHRSSTSSHHHDDSPSLNAQFPSHVRSSSSSPRRSALTVEWEPLAEEDAKGSRDPPSARRGPGGGAKEAVVVDADNDISAKKHSNVNVVVVPLRRYEVALRQLLLLLPTTAPTTTHLPPAATTPVPTPSTAGAAKEEEEEKNDDGDRRLPYEAPALLVRPSYRALPQVHRRRRQCLLHWRDEDDDETSGAGGGAGGGGGCDDGGDGDCDGTTDVLQMVEDFSQTVDDGRRRHHHQDKEWDDRGMPPPPQHSVGDSSDPNNRRKRGQVQSMLMCAEHVLLVRGELNNSLRHEPQQQHHEHPSRHDDPNHNRNCNPTRQRRRRLTIVDMGGGTGHWAIPGAIAFPHHDVVLIDLNRHSIELMKWKAEEVAVVSQQRRVNNGDDDDDLVELYSGLPLERTALPNLYAMCGAIERFVFGVDADVDRGSTSSFLRFDVGVALHLCGQSTDVAIRACIAQGAALIAAPCCVGKMNTDRHNPYVWQATGSNLSTIEYPQSTLYRQLLLREPDGSSSKSTDSSSTIQQLWNALASAADDSTTTTTSYGAGDGDGDDPDPCHQHLPRQRGSDDSYRRCCARAAKVLVEWDRCLYLRQHKYQTVLTRMVPITASPKHDIILAYPDTWTSLQEDGLGSESQFVDVDHDAMKEVEQARRYLQALVAGRGCVPCTDGTQVPNGGNASAPLLHHEPWSESEVNEVRQLLVARFGIVSAGHVPEPDNASEGGPDSAVYYFPTGMGRGRRKLIHYVASTLGLEHWSHGKKQGTGKTVAVALPGTRRRLPTRT